MPPYTSVGEHRGWNSRAGRLGISCRDASRVDFAGSRTAARTFIGMPFIAAS
jgi:hypothetical protein